LTQLLTMTTATHKFPPQHCLAARAAVHEAAAQSIRINHLSVFWYLYFCLNLWKASHVLPIFLQPTDAQGELEAMMMMIVKSFITPIFPLHCPPTIHNNNSYL